MKKSGIRLFVSAACVTLASSAWADMGSYNSPASACFRLSGSAVASWGAMVNASATTSSTIHCPIHNAAAANGNVIVKVGYRSNGDDYLSCIIRSVYWADTNVYIRDSKTLQHWEAIPISDAFPAIVVRSFDSTFMECTLPKARSNGVPTAVTNFQVNYNVTP